VVKKHLAGGKQFSETCVSITESMLHLQLETNCFNPIIECWIWRTHLCLDHKTYCMRSPYLCTTFDQAQAHLAWPSGLLKFRKQNFSQCFWTTHVWNREWSKLQNAWNKAQSKSVAVAPQLKLFCLFAEIAVFVHYEQDDRAKTFNCVHHKGVSKAAKGL
jgi:hypothetical protein